MIVSDNELFILTLLTNVKLTYKLVLFLFIYIRNIHWFNLLTNDSSEMLYHIQRTLVDNAL